MLEHGLDGVKELVLRACIEDQAYDAQCEDHRASWLYSMFRRAPEYEFFRNGIIAELQKMSEESSPDQLCELAGLMARDGDEAARTALRSYVRAQNFDNSETVSGYHALALTDGRPALIELARNLGKFLQDHPDKYLPSLDELIDDVDAYRLAFTDLTLLSRTDPSIAAYVAHEQQDIEKRLAYEREEPAEKQARLESSRAEFLQQWPVADIIAAAIRHDRGRGKFHRFGRVSSPDTLAIVLERLSVETDAETCLRLLWIFRDASPPYIPESLWSLAEHDEVRIRDAAITALAHSDDPAVGTLGRQYLSRDVFTAADAAAIELLTKHYKAGDEDLIMNVLNRLSPNEEEAHDIGWSIRRFAEVNNSPSTAGILKWAYETNPCTICRADFVRLLLESNSLPRTAAFECRFDASNEIQDLVR